MYIAQSHSAQLNVDIAVAIAYLIVFLAAYFAPTITAHVRDKKNFVSIFIVNLLLGWSIVGWVVALAWAFAKDSNPQPIVIEHHYGTETQDTHRIGYRPEEPPPTAPGTVLVNGQWIRK
jgi:purine-cytosine permease-like protein